MTTGVVDCSPPCTMRWTTASSSPNSAQCSRRAANTATSAASNPADPGSARRVPPINSCASGVPMFSARNSKARRGGSPATRAHLIDELPQLIARMRTRRATLSRGRMAGRPPGAQLLATDASVVIAVDLLETDPQCAVGARIRQLEHQAPELIESDAPIAVFVAAVEDFVELVEDRVIALHLQPPWHRVASRGLTVDCRNADAVGPYEGPRLRSLRAQGATAP